MNNSNIAGVNVDLDADDLHKVKSVKGLQKLKIFDHLSDDKRLDAENELAKQLGITTQDDIQQQ